MTAETKTSIQLSDIRTVEFECKKCHTVTAWPISLERHPPAKCPSCDDEQWMHFGGDLFVSLSNLLQLIRRLGSADGELFTMRFGVASLGHASGDKD